MNEITLQEVLQSYVDSGLSSIYTALPCIVVNAYLEEQRLDVQPVINIKDNEGISTPHPVILSVPLIFPASSTSSLTFPVNVGDTVLCVFAQRSTDVFKSSTDGKPQTPNDFRRLDKRDAIAIPGLWPFKNAINNPKRKSFTHDTSDTVLTHNVGTGNEVEVRLKKNGNLIINSPTKIEVNCTDAEVNSDTATINAPSTEINATTTVINSPTITFNGNTVVSGNFSVASGYTSTFNGNLSMASGTLSVSSGNITANGVSVGLTHTHSGVQTGSGSTGAPN